MFDVATVASVETRGKHNDFVRRGVYATHTGASCFSPVINVVRDPRWGRIQVNLDDTAKKIGNIELKKKL